MGNSQSAVSSSQLREAFVTFDKNNDKQIQSDEYAIALTNLGVRVDFKLCELCFRLVDTDKNTTISSAEFTKFITQYEKSPQKDVFDMIACAADLNNDGFIDVEEMKTVQRYFIKCPVNLQDKSMPVQDFIALLRNAYK
ncbi:Calmodulin [Hexamita inflata]|uniref:Calmodulin n=1 Tax=Hexamita inflata TaxID=28002 RepID=A0AA86QN16_9EUKA|nr:Calmodulin [Hexamita inflata]